MMMHRENLWSSPVSVGFCAFQKYQNAENSEPLGGANIYIYIIYLFIFCGIFLEHHETLILFRTKKNIPPTFHQLQRSHQVQKKRSEKEPQESYQKPPLSKELYEID